MKKPNFIKVDIQSPCSQDWSSMDQVEGKYYCKQCAKYILDLSQKTDQEIFDFFARSQGKICGRLRKDQIGRLIFPIHTERTRSINYYGILLILAALYHPHSLTNKAIATNVERIELQSTINDSENRNLISEQDTNLIKVSGRIMDAETHEPLIGATILAGELDGAVSDEKGDYLIVFSNKNKLDSIDFNISYVGKKRIKLSVKVHPIITLNVNMEDDPSQYSLGLIISEPMKKKHFFKSRKK